MSDLSSQESALMIPFHGETPPLSHESIVMAVDLAYLHLGLARRARMKMDRRAWDGEYARLFRARERAIERAKHHIANLREQAIAIDLLESMLRTEESTP
jgi:hypothetical protein